MSHNILAIETATSVCSVALRVNGERADELRQTGTGIHSEMVFVFTDELLRKKNIKLTALDSIILSGGPGSYTGLRVGSSAVKGMLFGLDINFFAANTLAGIAIGAKSHYPSAGRIHAVLDARRKHLYHQAFYFDKNLPVAEAENSIKPLTDFEKNILKKGDLIAGTGLGRLPKTVADHVTLLDEDIISALNLIDLLDRFHSENVNQSSISLIKKVAPERFEPYY